MRLTNIDRYGHFYTNEANCRNIWSLDGKKLEGEFFENQTLAIDGNAIDKLGELEDYEEKYGIDLVTLFKALKNGFETKQARYTGYGFDIDLEHRCIHNKRILGVDIFYFKDYGKTWALTKEELEND